MKKVAGKKNKSNVRVIRCIQDLFVMMKSHAKEHFIYRGENRADYVLRPKVGRYDDQPAGDLVKSEKAVLNEYVRRGIPYFSHPLDNEWESLAVAQHHGLATRLLDWTENPLIAAFFAVRGSTDPGDRVIYAMPRPAISANAAPGPFDISKVTLYDPKHISPRISAQSGLFTAHPNPEEEFKHPALERWLIDDSAVIELSVILDSIGFNNSTLFPGLDGLAKHINGWHFGDFE